ncbi:aldolase/citrate lyase family protein [Solirubrobacter phytolaccae]|uniref:Aldolase/citrate lyase family protein n=1 Tax=Solirubrobacter phytolaccae TaxID=1404360 RepID=A0A9X3NID3_9ACTN|nr:aldolase/citrate lyase family protein [Solirubrobacter phytolaccae]MDA0184376.1 aldolase/citrate lyase family protein [Solirubrobacter phytolaccae]
MSGLKARLAAGEVLLGSFLALGSAPAAEALALAGLDFLIVDLEHGLGDAPRVLEQVLAIQRGGAHALVRVESDVRERTTRMLDLGAEGVLCPRVSSAAQAASWAGALRYTRDRGVALGTRGAGYGLDPDGFLHADERTLGVVQIETREAVEACEEIAAVDGVDVLFVGPSDLSYALGCFREWEHPELCAATTRLVRAARAAGKVAGTFCTTTAQLEVATTLGFQLLAVGTDTSFLIAGARATTVRRSPR